LAVPELTHLESSVNNDNLLILLTVGLTLLVIRVLTGDTSRRTALAIGGLTTLALLTKGFALLFPAWIGLAYLVAGARGRSRASGAHGPGEGVRGRGRPAGVALAVAWAASIPGLTWWVHNKIAYGMVQPHGSQSGIPDLTPVYGWSDGGPGWLHRLLVRLNTTAFVNDQTGLRLHTPAWAIATVAGAVVLAAIAITLVTAPIRRIDSALLLLPAVLVGALVAKGSWEQFAARGAYTAMQGRYLYTGLAGITVVAVAAAARLPQRLRVRLPLAVLGGAALIQTVNLGYTVFLFWTPPGDTAVDSLRHALPALLRWYPLPPAVPVAFLTGTAIAALGALHSLLRSGRATRPDGAHTRSERATVASASRPVSTDLPA
jgi:hypothetical protein